MRPAATNLSPDEQRARVAALRGLTRAKASAFDAARASFLDALRLDPALDLTSIPTFWKLPRGGQQAAIDALELFGREHDASVLTALVRRTFRPRAVS